MRADRAVRDLYVQQPRIAHREQTRLWYRMDPRERTALLQQAHERDNGANLEQRRKESTAALRALEVIQKELDKVERQGPAKAKAKARADKKSAGKSLTDWRDAPRHAPVRLLSSSTELDARLPGPILGPGTRYRILTQNDGLVTVEVESLDGQVAIGYCKAADLISYEPEIMYLREEKSGRRGAARLGKLSQRIAGSLIG
jgi:hypothetical protein